MANFTLTRLIAAAFMLLALPACASDLRHFTLEFGMIEGNKDIEVLNWRYGNSHLAYTHADNGYLVAGHIPQAWDVDGTFPSGDVLYVKWRVLSTGKVYEDTVDLSHSLPSDMNDKIIHFSIHGPQLYVYLMKGFNYFHDSGAPNCPPLVYKDLKCSEIYPKHWTNF